MASSKASVYPKSTGPTAVVISRETHNQLRQRAAKRGCKIKDLVEQLLRDMMPDETFEHHRPAWWLAWQDYPHTALSVQEARELNKYCVWLEDAVRDRERQRDVAKNTAELADKMRWDVEAERDELQRQRNALHEAIHKTGHCPIAGCKGYDPPWQAKIFTHKHLDPLCVDNGCQSEFVAELQRQLAEAWEQARDAGDGIGISVGKDGSLATLICGIGDKAFELQEKLAEAHIEIEMLCPDCQDCKKHAYSDATTPGFFYKQCDKHREAARIAQGQEQQ